MPKENNTCAICGSRYYECNSCKSTKTFTPWRTITDTIECYKIYMIIRDYNYGTITKEKAKEKLTLCTIPQNLLDHIQKIYDEIMDNERNSVENKKIKYKKGVSDTNITNKNNE